MRIRDASPNDGGPVHLVAEIDGEIVGSVEMEYSFFGRGFVTTLKVVESHRRRGIGTALMEAVAARCETSQLFTSTNESNIAMQRLLDRLGYVASGVVHNLDPGDPELFYVRGERSDPSGR